MIFFYPNLTKKKKSGGWEGRGGGGAWVSDFFSKESKPEKNIFFEGMKVREDWLV